MATVFKYACSFAFAWLATLAATPGRADSQADAAAAFDAGIAAYQANDFAAAASHFLAADRAKPNAVALANALSAAERAGAWPLAANIASTVQARPGIEEQLLAKSREVMRAARPQVAKFELGCADADCALVLDGNAVPSGSVYVAPGVHRVGRADSSEAEQSVPCGAGATCQVQLTREQINLAVPPPAPSTEEPIASQPPDEARSWQKHVPLAVFIGSSAAAVTFVALTTWQGLKAVRAKDLSESDPDAYEEKNVRDPARAADYLLGASILATGAALATGIWWVDWKSYRTTTVSPAPGGALLTHRVQF